MSTQPGWYPDPGSPGGRRYYDGRAWTQHTAAPAPPVDVPGYPARPPGGGYPPGPYAGYGMGQPPWKGYQLGRPAYGPGSLANPGKRLAARLLDGLLLAPFTIALFALGFAVLVAHAKTWFPATHDPNAGFPAGILWFYAIFFGGFLVIGVGSFLYEALMTMHYGRTLGKRWMHIRPVRMDGARLTTGQSFGRAGLYFVASLAGGIAYIGLLDPLWCCWDQERQCIHDKIVNTIVVED